MDLIENFTFCPRIFMRVYALHPRLLNIFLVCRSQIKVNGTISLPFTDFQWNEIIHGVTDRNISRTVNPLSP